MDNEAYIAEIKNEYKKIDSSWLRLHFRTAVGLVLIAGLAECILGIMLFNTGAVEMALGQYVLKYILGPLLLNLIFIGIGFVFERVNGIAHTVKVYLISLIFVAICFVLYTVHRVFPSVYMIFVIPVLLTVVYSKYILTIVISASSIAMKTLSDFFVTWDPAAVKPYAGYIEIMDYLITVCILCAFSAVCLVVIRFERAKNNAVIMKEIERYQLQVRLRTDELTGISNKVALREAFQAMEDDDSGSTYILAMIDLDNFKLFNDTLGHDIGDQVLQVFGRILSESCGNALPFRFGGDEFCILFRDQAVDKVFETCRLIQERYLAYAEDVSKDLPITVSIGAARYTPGMTASQLIKITDDALYRSKQTKNTISFYSS